MKTLFLTVSIIISVLEANSQDTVTFYFDENWRISTSQNYRFKRKAQFDLVQLVFNGKYEDYDSDGNLIGDGEYKDGVKVGVHNRYSIDKTMKSAISFSQNDFIIMELKNEKDKFGIKDGTGKFKIPCSTYRQERIFGILEGEYLNGKRHGRWTFSDTEGEVTISEKYDLGVLTKAAVETKSGTVVTNFQSKFGIYPYETIELFTVSEESPESNLYRYFRLYSNLDKDTLSYSIRFPGGNSNLLLEIRRNLKYPQEARIKRITGKVIVTVNIDEFGDVMNYAISKSIDKILDDEAIRILKLFEKKWFPATLNGVPYKSSISIPITWKMG